MPTTSLTVLMAAHATDRVTQTIADLKADAETHLADARRDRSMGFFNAAERHERLAFAARKRAEAVAARLAAFNNR